MQLIGTEYVDVRLWGSLLYRGWIRQPTNNIASPETAELNLYGGMELLNGFKVQRNYAYLPGISIEQVFLQMLADFVTRSYPIARLTTWTNDTTGVSALGITVAQFQPNGKTFSQAMNDLCDLAPGQLIWGCDIDGSGNNRVYLRPRTGHCEILLSSGKRCDAVRLSCRCYADRQQSNPDRRADTSHRTTEPADQSIV